MSLNLIKYETDSIFTKLCSSLKLSWKSPLAVTQIGKFL